MKPASVLNLSHHPLNEHEISILSKGLKFIPKPSKSYKQDVDEAFTTYSRRMKLVDFFSESKFKQYDTPKKFYPKSKWSPADEMINQELSKELKDLKQRIDEINITQTNSESNLTKKEWQAIKSLRENTKIVIKPADKGSTKVIMSKPNYLSEGFSQLDTDYYKRID